MPKPKRAEPHTTTIIPKYIRERIERQDQKGRSTKQPAKAGKPTTTPSASADAKQEAK